MSDERRVLGRAFLEQLIFVFDGSRRYTQDSPVLPDVWLAFGCDQPLGAHDLLLTPHRLTGAGALARELRTERLGPFRDQETGRRVLWSGTPRDHHSIAYTHANVAACLHFDELVRVVLPMTQWWWDVVRETWTAEDEAAAEAGTGPRSPEERLLVRLEREQEFRARLIAALDQVLDLARTRAEGRQVAPPAQRLAPEGVNPSLFWMAGVVGAVAWTARLAAETGEGAEAGEEREESPGIAERGREDEISGEGVATALGELLAGVEPYAHPRDRPRVFRINRNRPASTAIDQSALAVKADAARRVFDVRCERLTWGVIDSGIDALHPAFYERDAAGEPVPARPGIDASVPADGEADDGGADDVGAGDVGAGGEADGAEAQPAAAEEPRFRHRTRVTTTYDFTRLRDLLDPAKIDPERADNALPQHVREILEQKPNPDTDPPDPRRAARLRERRARSLRQKIDALRDLLEQGREVDWSLCEELLEMPHDRHYVRPNLATDHGTHVAGILAADWREQKGDSGEPLRGVCPDLRLLDLRVLDEEGGEEFAVIAALQFVRHLNASRDHVVVHGVNLSLSITHDVANFACGRTPVCDECDRLVDAGVVVVAAAGNQGYLRYQTQEGIKEGYHTVSITDPGNAEAVITVGATHRYRPQTYGVSYFSSRGPTGDGRLKPDLVAPGEKVTAPIPGGDSGRKDGTSMAAPHVSGAAALLMARNDELKGEPLRIKQILCQTATDLGRERYFQGAGMLDALRAMQAV